MEEVGRFDQEYRRAMADAVETLDLTEVLATLRRWRQIAGLSRDVQAHRTMLEHVDRLNAGDHVPTTPGSEAKHHLGL